MLVIPCSTAKRAIVPYNESHGVKFKSVGIAVLPPPGFALLLLFDCLAITRI